MDKERAFIYKDPDENKQKIHTALTLLFGILIKRGHEVETATSGSQGIEVFKRKF